MGREGGWGLELPTDALLEECERFVQVLSSPLRVAARLPLAAGAPSLFLHRRSKADAWSEKGREASLLKQGCNTVHVEINRKKKTGT